MFNVRVSWRSPVPEPGSVKPPRGSSAAGLAGRRRRAASRTAGGDRLARRGRGRRLPRPRARRHRRRVRRAVLRRGRGPFGTVTAVINNAATARYGPLDDFSRRRSRSRSRPSSSARSTWLGAASKRCDATAEAATSSSSPRWPRCSRGRSTCRTRRPTPASSRRARTLRLELEGTGIRVNVLRCGETIGTDFSTPSRRTAARSP